MSDSLVQIGGGPRPRLPEWARKSRTHFPSLNRLKSGLRQLNLHTVCESARCPNIHECFHRGAATFMILGSHCTRGCGFCSVPKFNPARREMPLDPAEPSNVARMAAGMNLRYVVITSVNRDDLEDGGSHHFAATVRAVRGALPEARVEVLTPDFCGSLDAVARVLDAGPDVFNHNMETVPRLYPRVRPQAGYRQSLEVLAFARRHSRALTKSGFMVGLGETEDEVRGLLRDLDAAGTQAVTIGQYLQPTRRNLPVAEFIEPRRFEQYRDYGLSLGFKMVFSGPLVRSSYMADEVSAAASNAAAPRMLDQAAVPVPEAGAAASSAAAPPVLDLAAVPAPEVNAAASSAAARRAFEQAAVSVPEAGAVASGQAAPPAFEQAAVLAPEVNAAASNTAAPRAFELGAVPAPEVNAVASNAAASRALEQAAVPVPEAGAASRQAAPQAPC